MRHLTFSSGSKQSRYPSEIIESEIFDWHSRQTLPRHMSVPTTTNHRRVGSFAQVEHTPRVCHINRGEMGTANDALDILKYQLGDRAAQKKHFQNICANLQRRLHVAKSQGNAELVNILQDEYQQLQTSL